MFESKNWKPTTTQGIRKWEIMSKPDNQNLTNSLSNSQFKENGKPSDSEKIMNQHHSDRAINENLKESNARTINWQKLKDQFSQRPSLICKLQQANSIPEAATF